MSTETPESETSAATLAQPVYMPYQPGQDDSIDLVQLVGVLWSRKWLIAGSTLLFAAAGAAYALMATPVYRAEVVLAVNQSEQRPNISASLGGLASLAGINLGSSPDGTEAIATLRSRAFVEEFIEEYALLPVLFADEWDAENGRWINDYPEEWPDIRTGVKFFTEQVRSISEDSTTGLVTLAIDWTDPELAAQWAGILLERINERLRERDLENSERRLAYLNQQLEKASLVELRQAISRLIESEIQSITLAQAELEYAFKVIDPPRVPKEPVSPRRALILLLSIFVGAAVGFFVALFRWAAAGRRAA